MLNKTAPTGAPCASGRGPRWALRRAAPVLLALWLAACGGGGGGGGDGGGGGGSATDTSAAGTTVSGRFAPAQPGDLWTYSVVSTDVATALPDAIVRAQAVRVVDGVTGTLVSTDDGDGQPRTSVLRVVTAAGTDDLPVDETDPLTLAIGRLRVVAQPVVLGAVVAQIDRSVANAGDVDGDGRNDSLQVTYTVTALALETVATPAGSFPGSLHQRTVATVTATLGGSGISVPITLQADEWFAPDVGLVKSVIVSRAAGAPDSTTTRQLTAYQVGTRRSETRAPTLASRDPRPDSTMGAQPTLALEFSEVMDIDSLAGALTLVDAANQPVSGNLTVTNHSLRFTPTAALASGRYTAVLGSSPRDLAGNPLDGIAGNVQRWSFAVDASAPVVQTISPADTSTDAPVTTSVRLQFNEPVDPASVTAQTVQLVQDASYIVPATFTVTGSSVTVTPIAPLQRGVVVTVRVDGVTDLVGNPVAASVSRFTTDPGRFGVPVAVPGRTVTPGASAVGDLNGDGRTDVVMALIDWNVSAWQTRLRVSLQQPDGSMGTPIDYLSPSGGACGISSVAVGDVTGDGRADLLASGECGVVMWAQNADGSLAAPQPLSAISPMAFVIKLADMDGDGRLEVVGLSAQDATLRVWAGSGTAWALRASAQVSADTVARVMDFAIGDIDGDGRPDLVASGYSLPDFSALAIALQRADGSFAPVQRLRTPTNDSALQLALGDVNGDGRTDIVTNTNLALAVWLQRSDGSFAQPMVPPVSAGTGAVGGVTVADLNRDGLSDIVFTHGLGQLGVLLQQTDGTLAAMSGYRAPDGPTNSDRSLKVGDFNGDGRPDVLLEGQLWLQRPVAAMAQGGATPVRRALRLLRTTGTAPALRAALQTARATPAR